MIKNYYWAMVVMAAFVAGTIATATPVFAPPPEDDDDGEGGWKKAIGEQQQQIDELKANEILGFYKVDSSGTVTEFEAGVGTANRFANCDVGDVASGGGFAQGDSDAFAASSARDSNAAKLWISVFKNIELGDTVASIAICADFDPPHENED